MATEKNTLYCSFCGKSQHEVRKLIAGPSVFICDECVDLCNDIMAQEPEEQSEAGKQKKEALPVPHEIKHTLDDYVIGQEKAKKVTTLLRDNLPKVKAQIQGDNPFCSFPARGGESPWSGLCADEAQRSLDR